LREIARSKSGAVIEIAIGGFGGAFDIQNRPSGIPRCRALSFFPSLCLSAAAAAAAAVCV